MPLIVVAYEREDGTVPFRDWLGSLSSQAEAKVITATQRLELGNDSAVRWIGVIGEYRIDSGPGYRIYLAKDGQQLILLLGGGTKARQQRDIRRAKALWAEYKMTNSSRGES